MLLKMPEMVNSSSATDWYRKIATKEGWRAFLSSLNEAAPIESIGAAIVLFFTLQDHEMTDIN